jgi:hypothetical protein
MSICSLGQDLLNEEDCKDFELVVYDGKTKVSFAVHRLVLKVCSAFFARKLGGNYFFFYVWNVPENHIVAALRLIKFFYTRDLRDIGDISQTLSLCLSVECSTIYNLINQVNTVSDRSHASNKRKRLSSNGQSKKTIRPFTRSQIQMTTRNHPKESS